MSWRSESPFTVGFRAYVGFWFHCSPNPNLATALGFIGITRIHQIAIEGQEIGGELLARSVAEALRQVDALISRLQATVEAPLPDAHRQAECAAM